jgi:hypothetical protein
MRDLLGFIAGDIVTALIWATALQAAGVPGQIDSICRAHCEILAVQDGRVKFIDQWPPTRSLDFGKYVSAAQRLVPGSEAPVLDLRSPRGWRVISSVFLDHGEDEILMHLRFFDPGESLRLTEAVLATLEQTEIGYLFGGSDEIFAITSNADHSYNSQTEIWLLSDRGDPKSLVYV